MMIKGLMGATALATSLFIATAADAKAGLAAPKAAPADQASDSAAPQSAPAVDTGASNAVEGEIIVTGTRLRRPNDVSIVPITSVTSAEIFQRGSISVADVLNDLPQLRSTVSSQNSTSGLGVRGLNLLDLRGLGTSRTLVLVNGRRHVGAEIINNRNSPDINTFPTDLIERVDVTTGGSSSVYGSDAIAGVVNFVLKQNYEGLQLHGQAGVSGHNDAGNQYISLVAGKNFADGRGNLAVNLEYAQQEAYFGSNRPNLAQNDAFVVIQADPAGSVNGSDGNPDRRFFRDIRSTTISSGGQVGIQTGPNGPCGLDGAGASFTCAFLFQPGGALAAQTGTRVGLGPNGSFIGGNGYTSRDGQLLVLSPNLNRYAINVLGHFEITPALVPFIEAKFVRTEAFGSQSGPFFSQGQTLGDTIAVPGLVDRSYFTTGNVNREGIRLDNPYLSAAARATLAAQLTASTINPNTGAALTAANLTLQRAQIADGSFRFNLRRNYEELGIRDERITRDTYRIVAGVRGTFNDDWRYEASINYGEHIESNVISGNVNRQRFLLANDTVRNAAGQIVCRAQVQPAYAGTDRGGNPAVLAADIAACVPLNPFGDGSITDAARRYLTIATTAGGKATQLVAQGFVSGDLSQLFELPGGPVAFSLGGEYRRETLTYTLDPLTQAGYAFYNAIPSFNPPSFEVKEAFGEVSVPLIKDVPFFHELTLTGSGRVANYKGATGTVYAYSGSAEWSPIRDIRFRGSYSQSVRAPYLGELFSPASQNFAGNFTDPCSTRNLAAGSTTRVANCTAAGRPAAYDYVYSSSLEIRSGGNPNLTAETSTSMTIGGIITPRFLPGLSLSIDYYDITVSSVIASVTAQNILNLCYDSPTLNNPFCGLFQRAGAAGGARGEIPFRVLEGSLLQSSANFASRKARGLDVNATYARNFGWGGFSLKGIYTHVYQRDNFNNPANASFADTIVGELGDPDDNFNINLDIRFGKLSFGYGFRWIGPQYLNTFEDYNALNGLPPQNADYADIRQYPAITYSDLRVGYQVNKKFDLNLGVTNVFDQIPPYGLTGVGAGSSIYDNRGRFAFIGVTAKL